MINRSPENYHDDYCDESPESEEKLLFKNLLVITGAYRYQMESVVDSISIRIIITHVSV